MNTQLREKALNMVKSGSEADFVAFKEDFDEIMIAKMDDGFEERSPKVFEAKDESEDE